MRKRPLSFIPKSDKMHGTQLKYSNYDVQMGFIQKAYQHWIYLCIIFVWEKNKIRMNWKVKLFPISMVNDIQ